MTMSQFINSPVDDHLGYFQFGITTVIWIILLDVMCWSIYVLLSRFFLYLWISAGWLLCLCRSLLGVLSDSYICAFMAYTKWEGISAIYFLHQSLFLSFWNSSDINARPTSQLPEILLICFSLLFLSLLFRKDHFYWFIF